MDKVQNYINGKSVTPLSGSYSEVIDPSAGDAYAEAPLSRSEDVDAACQATSRAFPQWRRATPAERSLVLFRPADALVRASRRRQQYALNWSSTTKARHG